MQDAAGYDRAADDGITGRFEHGNALARKRGFVHRRFSVDDFRIDGGGAARPDDDDVADLDFGGRDRFFFAVFENDRFGGGKLHEHFDGTGRLSSGTRLKRLADGDKGGDHRRGFKIQIFHIGVRGLGIGIDVENDENKGGKSVKEGGAGSDGDERVHIGSASDDRGDASGKIFPVDDHDRSRQHHLDARRNHDAASRKESGHGNPKHVSH